MIPEGWDTYELGDLAEFKSGGTPSKQNDSYWGGAFPWVSAKDLKSHLITKAELGLTASGELQANVAPVESILVLVRGMTLLKDVPIGLVKRRVAFNQDIKALITNVNVDPLFLSYFLVLQKKTMMALVNTANHGTGRLDTELLRGLLILLPPLPEQRRIADILSTWDCAIETVEALIANARAQKKALMQSLLTGKQRLRSFSGAWRVTSLGQLGETYGGLTGKSKADFGQGHPFVTYKNVFENAVVDPTNVALVTVGNGERQHRIRLGDILFTTSSETPNEVGMSSVVAFQPGNTYLNSFCFGFRPNSVEDIVPEFAAHFFRGDEMRTKIAALAQGSTRYNISKGELLKLRFALPDPIEQQAIAQVMDTAAGEIRRLKDQLTALRQEKSALMQQLLTGKRRVKVSEKEAAHA